MGGKSRLQTHMRKNTNNLILLNIIFCISIVVANVVGCKVIDLGISLGQFPLLLSGGAITYAFTFLCTDIIGEIWGREEANKTVWRGFLGQLFALALIFATQFTPTNNPTMQAAYETLLGQTPMFVLGSLCAYFASQKWDVWVFHKIRNHFNAKPSMRWIWNNASTMTSQIIDTAIYAIIAFGLGMGMFWQEGGVVSVIGIIIGQYVLKFCLALLDTPFFYILTRKPTQKQTNMYYVSKRLEIAACHRLALSYDSPCQNLHGHNWHITVHCKSKKLNKDGMVVDFKHIKEKIHKYLDHGNLNELLPFNPTAENIARWVVEQIPQCYKAVVQESDGNFAIYEED